MENPQDRPEQQNRSERPDEIVAIEEPNALSRTAIKKKMQSRKKKRIGWAIISALALTIAGVSIYFALGTATIPEAATHNVELEKGDPCKSFAELTSNCTVSFSHSDTVTRDNLISQVPTAGFSLSKPDKVELIYSSGPEESEFPDIIRKDYDAVLKELYLAGIEVSEVKPVEKADLGPNRVISASIKAGTVTKSGSKVALEVSTETVALPNLKGLTREQAELDLQKLGFEAEIIEESSPEAVGTVIGQTPAPANVAKGSKITVKIAKAEEIKNLKVPTVVGLTETEASGVLAAAGFKNIAVIQVESSKAKDERVSHVVPGENRTIRSDSNVVLIVSIPEKK